MSAMLTYACIMAGCTAAGWALSRWLSRAKDSGAPIRKHPPGKEEAAPYRLSGALLTGPELSFHRALAAVVPPGSILLAKVRLADLLQVNYGAGDRSEAHARIASKSLDFLVCDPAFLPRLAICLDPGTDDRRELRSREFITRICAKAGLPLARLPLRAEYTPTDLRTLPCLDHPPTARTE